MLKLDPPDYKYCPLCGQQLQIRLEEERQRKFCPDCKWTYYPRMAASAGALILRDKQVLLVQRGREPYKGSWMLPSGFIDYGEHPEEAVIREVKEETGLEVEKVEFYKIGQVVDDPREPGHLYFVYRVEVAEGELKNDVEENLDIGWFDIDNPPTIRWLGHQQIIKELQSKQVV